MVPPDLRLQIYQKLGLKADAPEASKKPKVKPEAVVSEKPKLTDKKTLARLDEKRQKKRSQKKTERDEQSRLASMKEEDLVHSSEGIGGNERITMGDILTSIDADKYAEHPATTTAAKEKKSINTGKLRKQMKALKKEVEKAPALAKPVSSRKRKIQEQQVNYDINKSKLAVYLPQVKRAREEV